MKRITLLALIALLIAVLLVGAAAEAANPWIDCGMDLAQAAQVAGFEFALPALSNYTVRAIPGKLIEVCVPRSETEKIVLRKSVEEPEAGDISGDNTEYPQNATVEVNGVRINLRGEGNKICVASFVAFDGAYSVSCAAGMTKDEAAQILKEILLANAK